MTPEGLASRKALLIGWDAADWESLGGLAFGIRGIARLAQAEANARELGRLANKRWLRTNSRRSKIWLAFARTIAHAFRMKCPEKVR
jgi:hypothetical protein